MAFDEGLAERIRTAFAPRRDVEEKHMLGGVAFMVRGHMACGIVGTSLMVRISPDAADDFRRESHVRPMDFTGRPMRGFLYIEAPGIATAESLARWTGRAAAYAETLPPRAVRAPQVASARDPKKPAPKAKPKGKAKPNAKPKAKPKPKPKAKPKPKPKPKPKAKPKPKPKAKSKRRARGRT